MQNYEETKTKDSYPYQVVYLLGLEFDLKLTFLVIVNTDCFIPGVGERH